MKRKIRFHISEGSRWIEGYQFPQGGTFGFKELEFEQTTDRPFDDATEALRKEMSGVEYHIWNWTWLDNITAPKDLLLEEDRTAQDEEDDKYFMEDIAGIT